MRAAGLKIEGMQIFRCTVCGWFHLGRNEDGISRDTLRQIRQRKAQDA